MAVAETRPGKQPETKYPSPQKDEHLWEIGLRSEKLPPFLADLGEEVTGWLDYNQGWQLRRIKGVAYKSGGIKQTLVDFLTKGPNQESPDNFVFFFLLTAPNPKLKGGSIFSDTPSKVDVRRALKGFKGEIYPSAARAAETYYVKPASLKTLKPLDTAVQYPQNVFYFKQGLVTAYPMMTEVKDLIDSMPLERAVIVMVSLENLFNLLERARAQLGEKLNLPPTL